MRFFERDTVPSLINRPCQPLAQQLCALRNTVHRTHDASRALEFQRDDPADRRLFALRHAAVLQAILNRGDGEPGVALIAANNVTGEMAPDAFPAGLWGDHSGAEGSGCPTQADFRRFLPASPSFSQNGSGHLCWPPRSASASAAQTGPNPPSSVLRLNPTAGTSPIQWRIVADRMPQKHGQLDAPGAGAGSDAEDQSFPPPSARPVGLEPQVRNGRRQCTNGRCRKRPPRTVMSSLAHGARRRLRRTPQTPGISARNAGAESGGGDRSPPASPAPAGVARAEPLRTGGRPAASLLASCRSG